MENKIKNGRLVQIQGKFQCAFVEYVAREDLDKTKQLIISDEDRMAIGVSKCFDIDNNCVIDYNNSEDLKRFENQKRINAIKMRLEQLSQDLIQAQAGAVFEDLEERKQEFQTLHNELRVLLGKEPRVYAEVTNDNNTIN